MDKNDQWVYITIILIGVAAISVAAYFGTSMREHISKIQDPEERGLIYLSISVFYHALLSSRSKK